jgi:hypothetical protein
MAITRARIEKLTRAIHSMHHNKGGLRDRITRARHRCGMATTEIPVDVSNQVRGLGRAETLKFFRGRQ